MRLSNLLNSASVSSRSRLFLALFLLPVACGPAQPPSRAAEAPALQEGVAPPPGWADASAPLVDRSGAVIGSVAIRGAESGILIRVNAEGLSPGWHGMHLHEVGDCGDGADGFKKSRAHVDPDGHDHGLMFGDRSERGDLANIFAGPDGRAVAEVFRHQVTLAPTGAGPHGEDLHPLLDDDGFALLIHAGPDDHVSQPIGGSGDRVACAAFTAATQ